MLASLLAGPAGLVHHQTLHGRRLLAEPQYCTVHTWEQRGGVLLYALGVAYLVLGLIIVNNHYFMPSLRLLSTRLRLSDDVASAHAVRYALCRLLSCSFVMTCLLITVIGHESALRCLSSAGATVFAGGSSAPFVFFGFFSLLAPESAIPSAAGIASTVGAGNTNVLGVLGACGALCMASGAPDSARRLPAYPLLRDSACWAATVLVLGGIFADGRVHWWEGVIMIALYAAYVALNAMNPVIVAALHRRAVLPRAGPRPRLPSQHGEAAMHMQDSAMDIVGVERAATAKTAAHAAISAHAAEHAEAQTGAGPEHLQGSRHQQQSEAGVAQTPGGLAAGGPAAAAAVNAAAAGANDRRPTPAPEPCSQEGLQAFAQLRRPAGRWHTACWLVCLPWYLALAVTVPDCRMPRLARLYPATATLATAWVGAASWFMLEWTLKVGCVVHAPLSVMGATALAVSSTMLTALVSFTVAHHGKAGMAVANALGSNVFNVLIGLGLPYMVVQAARGHPAVVSTAGLWPDGGCLLVGLTSFLLLVAAARLRLNRPVGWALLAAYIGYLVYEILITWVWDVLGVRG